MTATARRRSGVARERVEDEGVVGAVDARLDEDGAADAVGVHQPGIVGKRRRDRRVVALRRQRIARGRSEDVNVRVAGPFRQAEAGPRPRLGGVQAEGRDVARFSRHYPSSPMTGSGAGPKSQPASAWRTLSWNSRA